MSDLAKKAADVGAKADAKARAGANAADGNVDTRVDISADAGGSAGASRGRRWLYALAGGLTGSNVRQSAHAGSVLFADAALGGSAGGDAQGENARFIAVVPDARSRFPRARQGEVGLEQGWALAALVRETIGKTAGKAGKAADGAADNAASPARPGAAPRLCPIIAIVDVVGQAYGRREELMGIHIACAAAANAYADARLAGHPVVALIVGHAMSGAFLAHGYQANRLLALDAPDVLVHAMGQAAAARITRRTLDELAELGERIPPMSYDIRNYAKLGLLERLIEGVDADAPDDAAIQTVRAALTDAVASIRADGRRDLSARYRSTQAQTMRAASIEVRRRLAQQW